MDVVVSVVDGPAPNSLGMETRSTSGEWSRAVKMRRDNSRFEYTFPDVRTSFQYRLAIDNPDSGPYQITVKKSSPLVAQGRDAAMRFLSGDLADYRLAIMLHSLNAGQHQAFLKGFIAFFDEKGERPLGEKYAERLRKAVSPDHYDVAYDQGVKHAKNEITDAQIQTLILRSLNVSAAVALGWKAGYVEGYADTLGQASIETAYEEAAAMYNALRAATGN